MSNNAERVQNLLDRYGERFIDRVFTDAEITKAKRRTLTGGAAARLAAMTPSGMAADIHLTLTDDHPWAQAFVIITACPV